MKSVLCCVLAYLVGNALLDMETLWAGLAGLVALPAIMAWPGYLIIDWMIPLEGESR